MWQTVRITKKLPRVWVYRLAARFVFFALRHVDILTPYPQRCGEPLGSPKTSRVVGFVAFRQVLFFFQLRHVDKFTPCLQR